MKCNNGFFDKLDELKKNDIGISIRKLCVSKTEVYTLYLKDITDREGVSSSIIKPILQNKVDGELTIDLIFDSIIFIDEITLDYDENKIVDYILKGNTVILIPNDEKYIIANTKKIEKRNISSPELESPLKAPKDSFNENFDSNLSLIRYRIKDESLKVDKLSIGERTKTAVAVVYINDIANPKYVNEVKNKLKEIHIDGIIESGSIQKFLRNKPSELFPQIGITERSDKACACLLEGKICIIVEGSNLVLIIPRGFLEFLDSGDDHYDNTYLGIFSKIIRLTALFMFLTLSALYVTAVSFHSDILPAEYILILAQSRTSVPFNSMVEALLMEFVAEILRESSIRLPKQIGPAIGIVGTIVIGQAAVSAGLVSSLLVILVSLTTMCSFISPDYTIIAPLRIFKFVLIILSGILGLFGFIMGFTIIFITMLSTESYGVPYLSPISPFNFSDLKNYILSDAPLAKKRSKYSDKNDKARQ
ncbi:spore germination protein [Clostridium estertheticum]|uniref:spore germination protein n=1 Tax=Clostridium estertheticum TaxID=238834 RepID=UPI0013E90BBE|nr:spore germination protein [Clostridium estertheticum]MBZ9686752.1 spore germination protein [Clostridium estertheticum]